MDKKQKLLRNNGFQTVLASLICIIIGFIIGFVVLLIISPAGAGKAITAILKNFFYYPNAAAATKYFGTTLIKASALLMCALSVIFAYKVGLFNIGAAGQYVIGAGGCLYMALKFENDNKEWQLWEEDIRFRQKDAVKKWQKKLADEIAFWEFCQYKFYQQWNRLKKYAHKKKIRLIGDIPLYVSMDSADVWAHSDLFELDERKKPINIAGVPPDCFSADGQRWGNPLYDWKAMEKDHFRWWYKRMEANAKLYDVIRIDHFIGIVNFWSIPASCPTAVDGKWRKGPGKKLTDVIKEATKGTDIIAEDLGVVGPNVRKLIQKTGWPGMKILEFAFDGAADNEYLPHNYKDPNCLVYGGTHDNETIMGFYGAKKKKELKYVMDYLQVKKKKQIPMEMIRLGYGSIANTAIFQMQDILGLDNRARMNLPSTVGTNWRWRMLPGAFTKEHCRYLKKLCRIYNR